MRSTETKTAQGEQGILPQALPPQGGGHLGETCHWALASPISRTASSSSSWKVRRSFSPRARGAPPPVPQDDHPVAEGGGKGVVGHHEDGGLQVRLGLEKGVDHRPGGAGIQISGGLVGQQEHGVVDEGAGHGGALLLPPEISAGYLFRMAPMPKMPHRRSAACSMSPPVSPAMMRGQEDVVPGP